MAKMFFIYVTGTSRRGQTAAGFLNDQAVPDEHNLKITVYEEKFFNEKVEELVAFFSRRKAQHLADELKQKVDKVYPNQVSSFEVKERSVSDKKLKRMVRKNYTFRSEQ